MQFLRGRFLYMLFYSMLKPFWDAYFFLIWQDPEDKLGRIPAFARLITRGPVEDIRSDISSLELFTVSGFYHCTHHWNL